LHITVHLVAVHSEGIHAFLTATGYLKIYQARIAEAIWQAISLFRLPLFCQ
jgi:hypothetical protein